MNNLNALNLSIANDGGNERYVIFNLAAGMFAVNCKYVMSIEPPSPITELANCPPGVRGICYYKDEAINIYDLRIIFGYPSHEQHVEQEININGHIMTHENWAAEIRAKVAGGDDFSTGFDPDPLKCGLGEWLANYKTINMNTQSLIKRIAPIHENFHKFAAKADDFRFAGQEDADKFLGEVEAVKNDLVRNLDELHNVLLSQAKELRVVLKVNGKKFGIIIDDAESVEIMDEIQELPPAALATEYISKLGFRKKDRQITLIIEAEKFA